MTRLSPQIYQRVEDEEDEEDEEEEEEIVIHSSPFLAISSALMSTLISWLRFIGNWRERAKTKSGRTGLEQNEIRK